MNETRDPPPGATLPLPARPIEPTPDPLHRLVRLAHSLRLRPDPKLLHDYLALRRAIH